ncbi:MAG TPA: septal ring lytic transglycosylase RlpA family protein [Stellaceae bacterium]|jgi:rare lipoprotein A|nr:septal ring lytic transglycosylase RlpA family protein [Stellaceae bacterium]
MTTRRLLALAAAAGLAIVAACSTSEKIQPTTSTAGLGRGLYKVGKPYQVDGIWYYPKDDWSYDETGIASWYGEQFHGRYTANGEVFDLNGLTAAHHTLPMPSIVQVTNLENGRSLELRVNDRGPFAGARIVDVSRQAAQLLGFERNGTAKVRVRLMSAETMQAQAVARRNGSEEVPGGPIEVAQAAPRTAVDAQPLAPLPGARAAPPGQTASIVPVKAAAAPELVVVDPPLTGQVTQVGAKPNAQIFIQAGAFAQMDNANRVRQRIAGLGSAQITAVRVNGNNLFRVRLGPIVSVDEADRMLARVLANGLPDARIVVD